MTTTATDRAAINRRNAQHSTGPKTPAGKSRSRFNALKHGRRALTLILPGEDPDAFQGRLDAWTADLQPRNDLEQDLVVRAATITWQLDRADRAEAARLTDIILNAPEELALRQADQAAALVLESVRLAGDPKSEQNKARLDDALRLVARPG